MPTPDQNHQIMIASLPDGPLEPSHFEARTGERPNPGDGEVLVETEAITIGAGQRAGLQGSASYTGAPQAGQVMGGQGVGRVVESNDARYAPGDRVRAMTGWQRFSTHWGQDVNSVDTDLDAAHVLGPLGINGLTAYFGLFEVGQVIAGDTVMVSAAAGSVGHMVGQMAKVAGATVVGVAGSDAKCELLISELGFDAAVNRNSDTFRADLKAATPNRVDVYFDNTGGPILESALFRMNLNGRITCCGAASQYDTGSPGGGPRGVPGLLVNNRVRMQGFVVFDFADRYDEARAQMTGWITDGRLEPRATSYDGLDAAPQAFVDLLNGTTIGTTVVRLD
ncbi:MAG: NADP-dependent oxidoreductase [Actinomycetota bacterium]